MAKMEVEETIEVKPKALKTVEVTSKLIREHYDLSWTIENFSVMPFLYESPLFGPSFHLGKEESSMWQLLMTKELSFPDTLPSLGFQLIKMDENIVWDVCRYDITVRSVSGDVKLVVAKNALSSGEKTALVNCVKCSFEKMNGEDVKGKKKKPRVKIDKETDKALKALFKREAIVVECVIRYTYMKSDDLDEPIEECQDEYIAEDLKRLLTSQMYSDIVLIAGKREFPAHKSILCARALGFDKIILEGEGNSLKELDLQISASVAELLLLYIYTEEFPEAINPNECYGLYKVAVQYAMKDLKDRCMKALMRMTTVKPFCKVCDSDQAALDIINELEDLLDESYESDSTSP